MVKPCLSINRYDQMMSVSRTAAALFAMLIVSLPSLRGQQPTTVRGFVYDASGAPVSGAILELASSGSQVQITAASSTKGQFVFLGVKPGAYLLTVPAAHGFAGVQRPIIVSETMAPIKEVLVPEVVTQAVEVGGAESVSTDAAANQDSVSVSGSSLDHLPVFDQNIIGTLTPFLDPSATSSSGVSLVVDGVELKGVNVSSSAIAEVRINSDPYSAEFASPGRGRLEITTRPGSPQFHGTFNFIARDATFNSRNYFAPVKPAEQRRIYEGHLTGPLRHSDRTSFMISGTRQEEDLESAVHAFGPQGLIVENAPTPSRANQITGRVTHDFSGAHRLAATYNFNYETNQGQNVGGIVLPEAGINGSNRQDQLILTDRILISPSLIQQLQIVLERETDLQQGVTDAQSIQVQDSFTGGGAQFDAYRTEHTLGVVDIVGWTRGKHYVRFGVVIPQISSRSLEDHSDRLGIFNFSSLADLSNGTPYKFTVQQGAGLGRWYATEVGAFVQDQMTITPKLTLTTGVRYQWQTYLNDYGNFAPRFSMAYAAAKKWVLRAGSGIFYDRTGGDFSGTFKLHNGIVLRQYQIVNPSYPNPLGPGIDLGSTPTSIVREQPNLRAAYQIQYSATAERQLTRGLVATATYRGSTGVASFRSRDANAPLPPYTLGRPDPELGFVQQVEAGGRSRLNALDLGLRGKAGVWAEGQAQYTFSYANNNTSGLKWYPQDQYHPNAEWGRSDLDRRHRLNVLATFYPDHWLTLGVAATVYSGAPYTELAGTDVYNTGLGNTRPTGVGRNGLQGSGLATLDLQWDHDFHLTHAKGEHAKLLNLGVSGFNILNHPNFSNFIGSVRSPLYQQPTTALPPRQLQFGLRYQF